MSVKIASLELENVKRIKAVSIVPTENGLTVIGGRNAQGKTSVLDAIAWALGGDRFKPANPNRANSATPAKLKIELSNGLVATRQGSTGALKVIDPEGKKSGQTLLNSFIEELALNLPKFMNANDKEKAEVLLDLIGLKSEIAELDKQIAVLSERRKPLKTDYLGKEKVAADMPFYPNAPESPISATDLIAEQKSLLEVNAQNAAKRAKVEDLKHEQARIADELSRLNDQLHDIQVRIKERESAHKQAVEDFALASNEVSGLEDADLTEIETRIAEVDHINECVRANQKKADIEAEAELSREAYKALSSEIEDLRGKRIALLEGANLPLEGLGIEDGALTYKGATWSDMSGAEQLRVATAIVRARKPECGFVLVDKLEQMDLEMLKDFGEWAETQGLQVIGTRVSTGSECSVVIEDGYDQNTQVFPESDTPQSKTFQPGVF